MKKVWRIVVLACLAFAAGCGSKPLGDPDYFNDRGEPVYLNKDGTPKRKADDYPMREEPPPRGMPGYP